MITLASVTSYLSGNDCYPFVGFTFTDNTFTGWHDDFQVLVTGLFVDTLTVAVIDQCCEMARKATETEQHGMGYSPMVLIPGGSILGGVERNYAKEKEVLVGVCQPTKSRGFIHILKQS